MDVAIWKHNDSGSVILLVPGLDPNDHEFYNHYEWEYVGVTTLSIQVETDIL